MSYHIEKGVLYSTPREDNSTFWRVSLHVDGVLADISDIQPSDYLTKMLDSRTEIVPVRMAYGDDGSSVPFEDCYEGRMTSDVGNDRVRNAEKEAVMVV